MAKGIKVVNQMTLQWESILDYPGGLNVILTVLRSGRKTGELVSE